MSKTNVKTRSIKQKTANPQGPLLLKNVYDEEERIAILIAFDELLKSSSHRVSKKDIELIKGAFILAATAHKDMRRKSGEPYIFHPIAVAQIVCDEINLDAISIAAALLHDVVEDTEVTLKEIDQEFGLTVAQIVKGLTKINQIDSRKTKLDPEEGYKFDKNSIQAENYKKILLTIGEDTRIILIKIADRLHNMRTMNSMPAAKQRKIAHETQFIYAPIAHRFGLYRIKSELEDLSLKYINRNVYSQIARNLDAKKQEREKYIKDFIEPLHDIIKEDGVENFQIVGRPKSIHSIWNKMQKKQVEFHQIFDLFAIRIIIDPLPEKPINEFTDEDRKLEKALCWKVYSTITNLYKPKPSRMRDWVSIPKSNGYESLHATVMGPNGRWVEVQIRTRRMDEIAEKGIAAHWRYKGIKGGDQALEDNIKKIREAIKDLSANADAIEFVNEFRRDLHSEEVFVFTPKGDVINLPANATVIDLAFYIHTDLGSRCIGAKVNDKLKPISTPVVSGDQVEIISSKKQKPSKDWLVFATTSRARAKIKSALKEDRKRVGEDGKEILKRKMRGMKIPYNKETIEEIQNFFKYKDTLDLFYNIAVKNTNLNELKTVNFIGNKIQYDRAKKIETINNTKIRSINTGDGSFDILDAFPKNIQHSIATCCNPVKDDQVFGIITSQHGVKIHSINCPNAADMFAKHSHRIVQAKWGKGQMTFRTRIKLTGMDDVGLVNKVTTIISDDMDINIRSISFDAIDGVFDGMITLFVRDLNQLKEVITRLQSLDGIYNVKRLTD